MDSSLKSPKVLIFHLCHRLSNTQNKIQFQKTPWLFLIAILLSLSSLYLLTSNSIDFIWVFAFLAALVISLTLALPHLPQPRFFTTKSHPFKVSAINPTLNYTPPVVWTIGSNPKLDKSLDSGFRVKGFSNGDFYEGEFHKGKCSGNGVYHYYMCGKYEGDWIDGKYDGYGVETWAKGSRYRGQYRQGLRHGIGIYRFYTGDVYQGEWSNGQSHGCGVYASEDGSKYVGEFKWGVKHGFGVYQYRNGDVYAGEYFADKMHGFGVYKFGNGHQYEGSWHEGRRQGMGAYTFRNGDPQSGYWQNGFLVKASYQTQSPELESHFSAYSCKVSTAIQKARAASEKAYNVKTVDDRVNKTVAAANRAANAARVAAVKAVQTRMHEGINSRVLLRNF
ncbi:uncharacterized protein LOC130801663 [Amaranthus tricolor]|uniref:uncharacterized protein LOC130801663 n=1 Tax=Amaranthus tricolor TaxID=29722 RepID=UPI00258FCA8E|nr:uncharacterized protein LOC130801663 [Amaranthus tricolor]